MEVRIEGEASKAMKSDLKQFGFHVLLYSFVSVCML